MRRLLLTVLLILAAGLATAGPPDKGVVVEREADDLVLRLQPLPASFSGTLPCADCPGIRYLLNLYADGVYYLRQEYVGKEPKATHDDIGRWSVSSDGTQLVLRGGREAPLRFVLKAEGRLRKLDLEGREIDSILNYDLAREPVFVAFEPRLHVSGMYRYMADAALLRECITERRYPVPPLADNLVLEQAYLKAQRQPAEELLVSAEVRIAMQPRLDGAGTEEMMIVERFVGIWPGETCGTPLADAELANTYWRLVRLGKEPVFAATNRREPHLRLVPGENRVQGHTGCNRLMCSYGQDGATLRFGAVATTRMACPTGMDLEQALVQALEATRRFNIVGSHLELFDADGKLLARFEATYF